MAIRTPTIVMPLYSRRAVAPLSLAGRIGFFAALILLGSFYGLMLATLPVSLLDVMAIPLFVMFLLILWLLPDIDTYNDDAIHKAWPIYLALFIVWPSYLSIAIGGLPWINPPRVALAWLVTIFMWSVATSSSLRAEMIETAKVSKPVFWFFMMFIASMAISLPFSDNIATSIQRTFNSLIIWVGMFFLGCHLFLRKGTIKKTIVLLMWLAAIVAAISIWESYFEYLPWRDHIPPILNPEPEYVARIMGSQARGADGIYRAHSVFPVSLTFAEFMALCMPFILHFIATTQSTRNRMLSLAAYGLFTSGIWVSGSRLGVVGWFEAHFLYLLFWSARRMYFNKSDMVAPALTYSFPAMFIGFWVLVASWQRLRTKIFGTGAARSSDDARRAQRDMAIPLIFKNPWGHGTGQGGQALNYTNRAGEMTVDSYFLTLALDFGVLGFIGYFGFFLSGAWTGLKSYFQTDDEEILFSGPLAISLLVSVVIKLVLSQEQMQPLAFLFMGAIMALAYRHRAQRAAARTGGEFDKDALILVRG